MKALWLFKWKYLIDYYLYLYIQGFNSWITDFCLTTVCWMEGDHPRWLCFGMVQIVKWDKRPLSLVFKTRLSGSDYYLSLSIYSQQIENRTCWSSSQSLKSIFPSAQHHLITEINSRICSTSSQSLKSIFHLLNIISISEINSRICSTSSNRWNQFPHLLNII